MPIPVRKTFIALLFIGIFLMTLRPILDPDFWWHLRTGQLIATTGTIPHTDPYSLTFAGKPWTAHEWLSELFIYGLYRLGGFPVLILVFSLIITGAFVLVYLRSGANVYVSGFTILLGAISTAPVWGVRPQILTLLFSSLFLFLLERYYDTQRPKWILPLPILTVLWVNLHAGYAMGPGIIGVYFFSSLVEWFWYQITDSEKKFKIQKIFPSGIILIASLLAVMLNPNGPRMYIYPFETLTSPSMQQFIQEWFSPDFHQKEWQPFALLLVSMPVIAVFGHKAGVKLSRAILIFLFGYMALRSMRNIPLFIIAAIPVLAEWTDAALFSVRQKLTSLQKTSTSHPALPRLIHFLILVLAILATAARFKMITLDQTKTEQEMYPLSAVRWILNNHPQGNIYNTYGWGGYLIWHIPDYPVFIDGRADLYGDKFIESYMNIYLAQPGWQEDLATNHVYLVLVETGSGIGNSLLQASGWELVFSDKNTLLFQRK